MTVFVAIVQLQEQSHLSEAAWLVASEGAALPLSVSSSILFFRFECQQRFRICKSQRIVQVVVVGKRIAVSLVGRVSTPNGLLLIQVYG